MSKNNAQEQIIAKLKESESILIAVNDSPSVDELSSALALTLAINNSGKHATAVSSGKMPDALAFLRPEKTFEKCPSIFTFKVKNKIIGYKHNWFLQMFYFCQNGKSFKL